MLTPLIFGFGVALGFAAWSQHPAIADRHPEAFALFMILAVAGAYLAGRRNRHPGSSATAIANAQAKSQAVAGVQLVVNVEDGARQVAARGRTGQLDAAEWRGSPAALDEAHVLVWEEGVDAEDVGLEVEQVEG